MALRNVPIPIPLSSIDSATFTGAYQLLSGAGGITDPCFLIRIINNSNKDVTVSYNGSTDHDFVPANTQVMLQLQTNSGPANWVTNLARGQKVWVKGAAGAGLVFLSGFAWSQGLS